MKLLSQSKLGFGMMRLPRGEDGEIDLVRTGKMVDDFLAKGFTYFDTAYVYNGSEVAVRKALVERHPRESFTLASKLPGWLMEKKEDADRLFEETCTRLGTDYIDFYLLHNVDEESWPNIEKLDLVDFVAQKKAAGKARHIGFSVHCQPELLDMVLSKYGHILEFVQIQLNYFDWEHLNAKALYETARKYNKPIIVMEPVRGGMLASPSSDEVRRILDDASEKAGQSGASYASYALRYASQLDGVLCTLSGMSTTAQMKENIQTFSGPVLTAEQLDAVHQAALKLRADIIVPCTGCNYCYECPAEIKIPKIFSWYNEAAAKGFHWIWGSLSKQYEELGNTGKDCLQCGNCQSHCPQKIQIIDLLQQIERKYEELKEAGE